MSVSTLIIDGGGTSTEVAVLHSGAVRARTELATFKPLRHDFRTDELCRALGSFLASAQLTADEASIRFCVIGMSGVWTEHECTAYTNAFCDAWMQYVDNALPAIRVMSDVELVLTAAFGTAPGVALIAGTGSIALARAPDEALKRCGGWGPRLDDEGGGFWMGREALRAVARMVDARGPKTLLIRPVAAYLRCDPEDVITLETRLRSVSIDGSARLARAVLAYAEEGDSVARDIAERGCVALHAIVHPLLAHAEFRQPSLVLHGSLFASDYYRSMVERLIRADDQGIEIRLLDDLVEAIAAQIANSRFM